MRMIDLIEKKKHGEALTDEEIDFLIRGYVDGSIPDYQMSAMAMAIYFKGMDTEEITHLTIAMAKSGDTYDLSGIRGIKVDKHSSGGVGDKTSIALIPWVASCGAKVAKMSGRGLGFTGGTLDKLESFTGFQSGMTKEHFVRQVNDIGCAIAAQTGNLDPADKKLYALRDATATVDSKALITSSIVSKKLASGADAVVFDVTCGSGAFMKTPEQAVDLAQTMIEIGRKAGRKMCAVISNMDEPLGYAVGNILEVQEAVATLRGEGPADVLEICYALGSRMLVLSDIAGTVEEGRAVMKQHLEDGSALRRLAEMVKAQGGDEDLVWHPEKMPDAKIHKVVTAPSDGVISHMECDEIGNASMVLGGGRETADDVIDLSVGIILKKKTGESVKKGEPVAVLYANDEKRLTDAEKRFDCAIDYAPAGTRVKTYPVVIETVD
ncbi:MAG: pyrimidine-nucleoside phosphorylase [Lachnospiraceae bacterium]|nr:pyrimidine-nucleoside phosphorylase [Lachnospiraceae bacterium]